jgi:hypothetical protein
MRIDVDLSEGSGQQVVLCRPDDFRSFSVSIAGGRRSPTEVRAALERLGRPEGEGHVFVDVGQLLRLAGSRRHDPRWLAALDEMVSFARSRGWVDAAGGVRAHVG